MWKVSLKCLETRTRVLTYYKEHSKESTRCKTEHSGAKPKCKLQRILKANEFIENSICIILFKTWFTCSDKEIFLFIIWIIILFYFLIMINIPYSKALKKKLISVSCGGWVLSAKSSSLKTVPVRPCLQAGRVTLVLARGLPWHSHISSYFQRRICKAARVTLELG